MVIKMITFVECLVQVMEWKWNGNHYHQWKDFITWRGRKVTNWGSPLSPGNGNGLVKDWTKHEERESIIDSVSWTLKIVNQTISKCNGASGEN